MPGAPTWGGTAALLTSAGESGNATHCVYPANFECASPAAAVVPGASFFNIDHAASQVPESPARDRFTLDA